MSLQDLECYLRELVQCFEGFVKATLLLLLLGLTAVFAMLYTIMNKLVAVEQRRSLQSASSTTADHSQRASYAGREETMTMGEEEHSESKSLKKGKNRMESNKMTKSSTLTKLDNSEDINEDTRRINEEHSKRAEDTSLTDSTYAKNPAPSSHIDIEEVPCAVTDTPCVLVNPPCEGFVECANRRPKRPSVRVCRDGRVTKRLSSPRASLVCTPSNCSLSRSPKYTSCLSHMPGCTSNGLYSKPKPHRSRPRDPENMSLYNHFLNFLKIMPSLVLNGFGFNYVAVFTIVSIVILSYLLPDISQKLLLKKEVKTVEKVLDLMTKEVNRAETACLTVAEELCCMHCAAVRDNATETVSVSIAQEGCSHALVNFLRSSKSEPTLQKKRPAPLNHRCLINRKTSYQEIALMSFVYTDSFDDTRKALL